LYWNFDKVSLFRKPASPIYTRIHAASTSR
jgi:hypothetical protein